MKLWRGQPDNWIWKPTARDLARIWFGFSVVFFALCVMVMKSPSTFTLTGRWKWLHQLFTNAFGSNGDIILYAGLGSACLICGIIKFRAKE